jgi:stage IV sporulation protein B
MKKRLVIVVAIVLTLIFLPIASFDFEVASAHENHVYLGGYPIGISMSADGLIVVDIVAVNTDNGEVSPLCEAGIKKGDILLKIDNQCLSSIYHLKQIVSESEGEVVISYKDAGGVHEANVQPAISHSGEKKLGVVLKEDVSGIGTMTFVTLDGRFGALGHHIADEESGLCDELCCGKIYSTNIDNVVKGDSKHAGGLVGTLNRLSNPVGTVESNCNIGIYGRYSGRQRGNLVRVASVGEAEIGKAQIYTTIDGDSPKFYDVEIVKVVDQNRSKEKGLVIVVRDEELIEKTGGIVQGMSGSPIVQNGALIGAVTHVFVGDSTRGYGVHSRFMLEKSGCVAPRLAA